MGHACLEAGKRFSLPEEPCYLVLLAVASQAQLLQAVAKIEMSGIRYALFFEPDDGMGYTVVCTEAIQARGQRLFRSFRLWSRPETGSNKQASIRGPPRLYNISFEYWTLGVSDQIAGFDGDRE